MKKLALLLGVAALVLTPAVANAAPKRAAVCAKQKKAVARARTRRAKVKARAVLRRCRVQAKRRAARRPAPRPVERPAPPAPVPPPAPAPVPPPPVAAPEPPAPPAPPPVGSTRENPIPFAVSALSGTWEIATISVIPDAWNTLAFYNRLPPEIRPPAGQTYFVAEVSVRNVGPTPQSLFMGQRVQASGTSGKTYDLWDHPEQIPSGLDQHKQLAPGRSQTGRICWIVDTADIAGLLMATDPDWASARRVFFSLTP